MTSVKVTPDNPPAGAENPSFTTKVHFIRKRFIVSIQLHHIPDKLIDLEVTPTHFALNTLKYSKKYHLRFRFPEKIKVDENDVEADFSSGVLTVTLKIVQILDTNTGKLMAFKGKTKSTPSAPGKQQKSRVPIESSDSEDEPSEEDSEEENGDYSEEESEEKPAPKKKSKAPASRSTELKILQEVADAEETKRQRKLKDETQKEAYFQKKTEQKEATKEAKKSAKEATMKKLYAAHEAEKRALKEDTKKSKRVVQFEDEGMEAPPAKKAKGKSAK